MPHPLLETIAENAGLDPAEDQVRDNISELMQRAEVDPAGVVAELLRTRRERESARHHCGQAAEAAMKLQKLVEDLQHGSARLVRLVTVDDSNEQAPAAICAANGYCQRLPIHPDVSVEKLRGLKTWEYVAINEDVVVDVYRDDPALFSRSMGQVVGFRGIYDATKHLVRVSDGPQEKIVTLDPDVDVDILSPADSLIVQNDRPECAIAVVPGQAARSRFEVPIEELDMQLEDLAGIEEIADMLLRDILLHTKHAPIRDKFQLDPLKGLLLYSAPGMGKTALVRALARFLHDHRDLLGADIVLYYVKPNETKSMWHGEDGRIVRVELFGAIRARQQQPRERPLIQLVLFDEIDSFGSRPGQGQRAFSPAQSESLEALLVELDGLTRSSANGLEQAAHLLCVGLTNRIDRVDEALKRPGRFDRVIPMPPINQQQAEDVMMVYARGTELPWFLDDQVQTGVSQSDIYKFFITPAVAWIFNTVIARSKGESQRLTDITAGEVLTNVHYMDAMNRAKRAAAIRALTNEGIPAVTIDDILDGIVTTAIDLAKQLAADPHMLIRRLDLRVPITGVEAVSAEELEQHRYLRIHSA